MTVDGVEIAVDPISKTLLNTSGINKLSLDKTIVGIDDGNGGKEIYPYSDKRQILQVRTSKSKSTSCTESRKIVLLLRASIRIQ